MALGSMVINRVLEKAPREVVVYSFFDAICFNLIFVVYAPYLKALGFTGLEYGIVGSITSLAAVVASILVGWRIDRYRALPVFITTLIIDTVGFLLLATGYKPLIILHGFLMGFIGQIMHLSYTVLISRLVRESDYHYTYTYVSALSQFGAGTGSLMGWIPGLIAYYTMEPLVNIYRYTIIAAALSRLPLILVIKRLGSREASPIGNQQERRYSGERMEWSVIARFVVTTSLIAFGASISIHNISYYFVLKYHVESWGLGTIYSVIQYLMAIVMLLLPDLADRIGSTLGLFLVLTSSSIPLLVLLTLVNDYVVASIIYIVRTMLMNVANPLLTAFEMKLIPRGYRGRGYALISLSWMLPTIPGRGLGGYLLDVDVELPLRITAITYTIALVLLAILFRKYLFRKQSGSTRV